MEYNQEKWFDQVFADAGLSQVELEATKKVFSNESVANSLRDTVLSRSDYSKNMDKLRMERTEFDVEASQQKEDYLRMVAADHNNQDAWAKLQEEKENLSTLAESGSLYNDGTSQGSSGLQKDAVQQLVANAISKSQEDTVSVMNEAISIYDAHNREFGEGFNLHEVVNHAMRNGLPIRKAYEDMTQDQRTEVVAKKHADALDAAKKEGYQDAISQHNIPVTTSSSRGIHPLRPSMDIPTKKADRISAALEGWRNRDTSEA
jgi:hypothetical protein